MNNIKKEYKKANINAKSDFDFYQLQRKSDYLLDCQITREMDEIYFEYMVNNEKPFESIKDLTLLSKFQALINIQCLLMDAKRIRISLDPHNLYIDNNMRPKVMDRDVYEDIKFDELDFVKQYKSLIGYLLQNKYTFNDFYQGGNELLSKNKITANYVKINNLDKLVNELNKEFERLQTKRKLSIIEVDKKKYTRLKITSKITIIILVLSIILGIYFGGYRLHEESIFKYANEQYIKQDYISVIDTLDNISIDRMNINTKYILAVSNVKSESLNDEQKNNILSSVSLNSDSRILEFWIYLGKSDMDKAIDIAKQIGNNEYLAYAYMKEKAKIENDKNLSGSSREEKLNEIEENLKKINLGDE